MKRRRESNQTMTDFISKFDQKYNKIVKLNMTLPSAVLAFMLLKKANISKSEKMLVLTGMDYNKKEELYDQAKKSLLKFKGEQGGGGEASAVSSIKLEPVFLANQEEALWNAGYVRRNAGRRYRGYRGRPWQNFQRRRGNYQCGRNENYGNGNLKEPSTLRPVNPKGSDGRVMLCVACGSFRHLVADCPDSWENMKSVSVNTVEHGEGDSSQEVDESVMFTMVKQDSQNVGCKQSQLDPALFYMIDNGELIGIVASHVDDFLHSGTQVFEEKVMSKLRKRFVAGKIEEKIFRYVGFDIIQDKRGIIMDQSKYISNMEGGKIDPNRSMNKEDQLTSDEQTLLRQIVGRLNWAVQGSRPDMSFDMIELSTKLKNGTVGDLIRAIKCIRKLQTGSSVVRFQNLGQFENWKLAVYTDAAHANLDGIGSVGAHIIFLMNPTGCVCPLSWVANKIKRVVRSTLSAEMLSLQEGLEDAIYLRKMITEIFDKQPESLPIKIYVDNKSVTQAIYSTKLVDDKRLRLDIASVKESMENNELSGIKWIPSEDQLANCMTKRGTNGYKLMQVLFNGLISI